MWGKIDEKTLWKTIPVLPAECNTFASVLQVPVGALQVSPQDGTKQSVENKTDSSEITSDTTSVRKEEKTLDFALNGGSFIEGYQSPSSYPADKLPDGSVISKPGYAFAGWYDNKEFSGEAVTKIDTSYKGPLVLYANGRILIIM